MLKSQMFIALALLVGVAIGYFAGGRDGDVRAQDAAKSYVQKKSVPDHGEAASVKALRHRIAELESLLAERESGTETAISNALAEAARNRPPEPPRGNWRERMEEMKKNDPERYAQMTNRFANWRRNRAEQARNKIDFLSSIDTSHMSAKARKTHDALQELVARREEIEEQLHQEDLSDADRIRLMDELRSTHGQMRRLNGEERQNLLDETVRNLGFEGADAKEVTATIQDVIRATDDGWGGPPGGRRGPPHGGSQGGARGR